MPTYAGKVKCIYIDPPYNTGNEGWCYNDNVRGPLIQEWLKKSANPVDKDDLERHDKWLCMMWPRLQLMKELLSEDGSIFVSIDDIEQHHLRLIMDEVFGGFNFVCNVIWQKKYAPQNDAKWFSDDHDFLVAYAKNKDIWRPNKLSRLGKQDKLYTNPDDDPRGPWQSDNYTSNKSSSERPNLYYPITNPNTGKKVYPSQTRVWAFSQQQHEKNVAEGKVWWGINGKNKTPRFKRFLSEVGGVVPRTIWLYDDVGHNQTAKREILEIFSGDDSVFETPKPTTLIEQVLRIGSKPGDIVLDSFSGSGTTAHAVLKLNGSDDGPERKFILVECEDYADKLTAERVRRVIKGVPSSKDKLLKSGLGGSFTFCTLGDEINIESLLKDGKLPDYDALARYVFYTATGETLDGVAKHRPDFRIGATANFTVHLVYRPDRDFLRSADSALHAALADRIANSREKGKRALVFATAKFMGQKELTEQGIEFCQLPYAIHRILGD
jgi:adenine-specific DNA-methyltransferase